MNVFRQLAGMPFGHEGHQFAREACHGQVYLLRVDALHVMKVHHNREIGIHRVQQPEIRHIGSREICHSQTLLPALLRKGRALGSQDFEQATHDVDERPGCGEAQRRGDVILIQDQISFCGAAHFGNF